MEMQANLYKYSKNILTPDYSRAVGRAAATAAMAAALFDMLKIFYFVECFIFLCLT